MSGCGPRTYSPGLLAHPAQQGLTSLDESSSSRSSIANAHLRRSACAAALSRCQTAVA